MIKQPVPEIVRILSESLTSFDMYYVANRDEWQDVLFRNGYNKFGIGGVEQYDNEGAFHEYPGETMFYHLQLIKDAINPQSKLSWFLYPYHWAFHGLSLRDFCEVSLLNETKGCQSK